MASNFRVYKAIDSMFYRRKKKDKEEKAAGVASCSSSSVEVIETPKNISYSQVEKKFKFHNPVETEASTPEMRHNQDEKGMDLVPADGIVMDDVSNRHIWDDVDYFDRSRIVQEMVKGLDTVDQQYISSVKSDEDGINSMKEIVFQGTGDSWTGFQFNQNGDKMNVENLNSDDLMKIEDSILKPPAFEELFEQQENLVSNRQIEEKKATTTTDFKSRKVLTKSENKENEVKSDLALVGDSDLVDASIKEKSTESGKTLQQKQVKTTSEIYDDGFVEDYVSDEFVSDSKTSGNIRHITASSGKVGSMEVENAHIDEKTLKSGNTSSSKQVDTGTSTFDKTAFKDFDRKDVMKNTQNYQKERQIEADKAIIGNTTYKNAKINQMVVRSKNVFDNKDLDSSSEIDGDSSLKEIRSKELQGEIEKEINAKHILAESGTVGGITFKNAHVDDVSSSAKRISDDKELSSISVIDDNSVMNDYHRSKLFRSQSGEKNVKHIDAESGTIGGKAFKDVHIDQSSSTFNSMQSKNMKGDTTHSSDGNLSNYLGSGENIQGFKTSSSMTHISATPLSPEDTQQQVETTKSDENLFDSNNKNVTAISDGTHQVMKDVDKTGGSKLTKFFGMFTSGVAFKRMKNKNHSDSGDASVAENTMTTASVDVEKGQSYVEEGGSSALNAVGKQGKEGKGVLGKFKNTSLMKWVNDKRHNGDVGNTVGVSNDGSGGPRGSVDNKLGPGVSKNQDVENNVWDKDQNVGKSKTMGKVAPSCDIEENSFLTNSKFYPALSIITFCTVIVQYVINALSSTGPDGTLFINKTGDLSDVYPTDITPAGWTFSIWGFIYAWQAAWVVYSLINNCRKSSNGNPAYRDPPFLPNTLFLLQIIITGFNIGWLISFDRQEIELAFVLLVLYTLLQYAVLQQVVTRLFRVSPTLIEQKRAADFWLTQAFVCNGIGIQLAWVNIATLLNMQMVLIYSGDKVVCLETAGTIALSILAVHVLVLPALDMIFLDRYLRYTITPYIVVVVALAGSISKNWDEDKTNSIYSATLIAYSSALLCVKIGVSLYRHCTRPSYRTECDQWEII